MAAYINIEAINGKRGKTQTPLNAARHNLREIEAELEGRPGARISPNRTALNKVLSGPASADGVMALLNRMINDAGAVILRKDNILMFEIVISVKEPIAELDGFFEAAKLWMVAHYDCPLISAVVHYDEAEPHMHLLFTPIREGKLKGHKIMGNRFDLSRMQADFQNQIGQKFGLSRKAAYPAKIKRWIGKHLVDQLTCLNSSDH